MPDDFPADLDWGQQLLQGALYAERRARRFGLRITGAEAKAVAGQALEQIIAAGWDRTLYAEFADCVESRVRGIIINRSRKKATRQEVPAEPAHPSPTDPSPSPEQVAADRQLANRATTLMLERLDGNADATAVFMEMAQGNDRPADIAAETRLAIGKVYRARERISDLSAEIAAALTKELAP